MVNPQAVLNAGHNRGGITRASKSIEIGKKYGMLTVIEKVPSPNPKRTNAYYKCICECGTERNFCGKFLRNGTTKSCGCFRRNQLVDTSIIGKKYGMLTVLEIDRIEKGKKYVKCSCECGNEKIVNFSAIQCGDIKSCGCLNESFGERKIKEILSKYKLTFKKEYAPLKNPKTDRDLRFDFAVKSRNGKKVHFLIEYDGIQHYQEVPFFKMSLSEVTEHDNIKNIYCQENNIKLLRIPYWDYNNIENILINFIKINFPKIYSAHFNF